MAIVIVAVLALSAGYYVNSSGSSGNTPTIQMEVTDGTPQNGGPDEILPTSFNITEGEHYTVVFDNPDDGPHELVIPGLDSRTMIVQGGATTRVALTANKLGTFDYYQPQGACISQSDPAVSCTGVQDMNGTVTVLPPP